MKKFVAPKIEVVVFEQNNLIVTSSCVCVDCNKCPEGSDDCEYVDTCPKHCARDN